MAQGVRINIGADASGVRKGVDDAERSLNRLHTAGRRTMQGIGIASVAAGAAIGTGLVAAISTGTGELLEQEKASAQTEAALKSTGNQAHVTQKQIEGMASSLQAATGIADDQIQSMQNLLLTFTNVRNVGPDKIFNQATRAALDLSVAFHKDLNGSAIMLGKALNDPVKGLTALGRAGVQFTSDQKEQIKTLVESNRTLDAQKIILRELNKQVGGSAVAAGNTTVGQVARIKRAWEDVSQSLVTSFLPLFTRVARGVLTNMDKVQAVFDGIKVFATGMVNFVSALFEGDWQRAWNIAADGAGKALRALGKLATKVLYPMAVKMGNAIAKGLADGLDAGLRSVPGGSAVARFLGLGASGTVDLSAYGGNTAAALTGGRGTVVVPNGGGWATGGFLPGTYAGVDTMTIRAAPGEVILTPNQQRIVGIDRIVTALRSTGGVVGGDGFATGGVVGGAYERATSKLGTKYQYGVWDCSKFATYVAGVNVGGSTASAWQMSSEVGPNSTLPIVWGFRNNANNDVYDGGPDEHMGVRVNGRWFDNGGGGVQSDANSARWEHVRVPRGLENLGTAQTDVDTRANTRGVGRTIGPVESMMKLLNKAGIGVVTRVKGKGGSVATISDADGTTSLGRARQLTADRSGVPDYSSVPTRGSSLTAGEQRTVDTIGRKTAQNARDAGVKDPQEIARLQNESERNEEIRFLRHHVKLIDADRGKLHTRKGKTLRQIAHLKTVKRMKPGEKRKLIAALRRELRNITAEMDDLVEQRAEVNARLMEIGEQIAAEIDQASYDAEQEKKSASEGSDSAEPTAPTADEQALLDQANARADAASRSAAIGASFVRTILGSGSIDPGSGGLTINFNSLHPGDPQIQAELASWTVGALGGQGSVPATSFASAA